MRFFKMNEFEFEDYLLKKGLREEEIGVLIAMRSEIERELHENYVGKHIFELLVLDVKQLSLFVNLVLVPRLEDKKQV